MKFVVLLLGYFTLIGCAARQAPHQDVAGAVPCTVPPPIERGYHLHLPGIGGYRSVDRFMLTGLVEGGFDAEIHPYDWTGTDAGLAALLTTQRHRDQSAKVAAMLLQQIREHPNQRVTVTTHSAGAGIIAWALVQLPSDVQIDTLMLLSPALSPSYDLSPMLRHVRGKVYVLHSTYDVAVLGMGTKMFGTVDGVKVEAAGKVGFVRPPTADAEQYAKLVQIPYRSSWIRLGNIGDHIGTMSRPFSREVLAPLLVSGTMPKSPTTDEGIKLPPPPSATTVPATQAAPAAPAQ